MSDGSTQPPRRLLLAAGVGVLSGAAVMAHAFPALSAIGYLRRLVTPRLCGIGRTGHVALTFDDGPDRASTPAFLDELDQLAWKATFFMLGSMVDRDPGMAREVADRGHEVAVHGYTHRNHLFRGPMDIIDDLRKGTESVAGATGTQPLWFRPPYGVLTTAGLISAKLVGIRPVLWTTWGRDWRAKATPESVLADIGAGLAEGCTILLHDSDCTSAPGAWGSALGALPLLAEQVARRSWTVGTLADHGVWP